MAHNTVLSAAVGVGDTITDVDLTLATYPTTGKLPASCLFVSANATTAPTPVTAANALYVQPGTSTTWAATQSGVWNITNISGTVSLPTGAATAAKQPALGTAGTASADVITIQGIASMTAVKVDGSAVTQPVSGTVAVTNTGTFAVQAAQSGTWNVGTVTALTAITNALPAGTNNIGDVDVLTVPTDPFGANADAASATGSISAKLRFIAATGIPVTGTVTVTGALTDTQLRASAVPVSLTSTTVTGTVAVTQSGTWNVGTVTTITNVVHVDDNAGSLTVDAPVGTPVFVRLSDGAAAITTLPVSLASVPSHAVTNAGTFAVQVDNTVTVGSHAVTNAGTFAVQAAQSGTWNVGTVTTITAITSITNNVTVVGTGTFAVQAAQSGTWTMQPGNTANTTPWLVNDRPATSGGLSTYTFLSTAAVQAAAIKASPGQVYAIEFFNVNAAAVYVRLYNMTTTPGTGDAANILWRGIIPGNTAGAGFVKTWDKGIAFSTGIGIRVSAAIADADATVLAANTVIGNCEYV